MARKVLKRGSTSKSASAARSTMQESDGSFPVAAIGASAGGLKALGQLLPNLPQNPGMAFIIIQHLDPKHGSLTPEILAKKSQLPVSEAKDGMRVESNHVYVMPPNCIMAILRGVLRILPRTEIRGQHLPINFFFQSLAKDRGQKAIGVILSGTATDGTVGLQSIRAEGGLTIAQQPATAKYDGMPRSAISSGGVDLILNPGQIAEELVRFARHPVLIRGVPRIGSSGRVKTKHEEDALTRILIFIRNQCHVDFTQYKHTTIKRRIARRMVLKKKETLKEYAEYLEANPEEGKILFSDLLINVTSFFRDPETFSALKTGVFPELMKNKAPQAPVRIWVVGCSTGEEAYSLAISLLDYLGEKATGVTIQIFATDISETAVQKARIGAFPDSISQSVSKERLQKYFTKTEEGYRINKFIRDMCLFSRHDVVKDPPFAKLDLISCRNLLIYFESTLQKRVLPIFHYALNPGGFLWLGRSESVGGLTELFTLTDKTNKFYIKKTTATSVRFHFPTGPYTPENLEPIKKMPLQTPANSDLQRESDRATLLDYAPPSVVVNSDMDIVLTRGDTSPYLAIPVQPSLNLLKMVRKELAADLRMAIQRAKKRNGPERKDGLSLRSGGHLLKININVRPLAVSHQSKDCFFLIHFELANSIRPLPLTVQTDRHGSRKAKQDRRTVSVSARRIEELERELEETKSYHQSLVADFEAAQEELTSGNEELQSTNEELQSTNEELETAKEELQSTNEELTTVNDEMQNRNAELVQLGNDLMNLLSVIDIPIIMVGSNCQIRRFTPRAGKMLNLIQTDVGRPIGDIKANLDAHDLNTLAAEVIETITPKELEVRDREGHWFRLQIKPYRTVDNRIDGAVISLVDIDILKRSLEQSKEVLAYTTAISDAVELPLVVLDSKLVMRSANRAFHREYEHFIKTAEKDFLTFVCSNNSKKHLLEEALIEVLEGKGGLKNLETRHELSGRGHRTVLLNAQKIKWEFEKTPSLLLSIEDITERRETEKALKGSEARFHNLVTSAHDGIICTDDHGKITFANNQIFHMFGYSSDELIGQPIEVLVPEKFRKIHEKHRKGYVSDPKPRSMGSGLELFGLRKDGSEFPIDVSLSPSETSEEILVTAIIRDISYRKAMEKERSQLLKSERYARGEAEKANQTKDAFLAILSHELRTPLTSILSWTQLLQRIKVDSEKVKHGIDMIQQSAKTQGQLIDDLLDVSRIQSGKMSLNISVQDPLDTIRAAIDSVRLLAESNAIHIETRFAPTQQLVSIDANRLQQVIWNLLTNAIKFSPKGETIQVKVASIEENGTRFVSIQVVDHGKGIKKEFLPHIFERFTQEDTSSVRVYGGLGLGLTIVRDLLKLQGGTVRAESEGEGKGATFTVLLPEIRKREKDLPSLEAKKYPNESIETEETWPNLTGLSVLLVENEPSTLEILFETLSSLGAKVISCPSVAEAMIEFKKFKPDILVSDIAMPVEDGYSLIRKIRALGVQQGGNIPAIALTAYASEDDVNRALAAGYQIHIAKPFDGNNLARMVFRLATKKQSES